MRMYIAGLMKPILFLKIEDGNQNLLEEGSGAAKSVKAKLVLRLTWLE